MPLPMEPPPMNGLQELGVSGPFEKDRVKRWYKHPYGLVRWLGLAGYKEAMILAGMPHHEAADIFGRMQRHGCERVVWAAAMGTSGRRRLDVWWDVRVAVTRTPAEVAVPEVTAMAGRPIGYDDIGSMAEAPGVLAAFSSPVPDGVKGEQVPGYVGQGLPVKAKGLGYAVMAVGRVGATAWVCGKDVSEAERALVRLVEVVVSDMRVCPAAQ